MRPIGRLSIALLLLSIPSGVGAVPPELLIVESYLKHSCSVAGTTECNLRDLVFLKKEMDAGPGVGDVETR